MTELRGAPGSPTPASETNEPPKRPRVLTARYQRPNGTVFEVVEVTFPRCDRVGVIDGERLERLKEAFQDERRFEDAVSAALVGVADPTEGKVRIDQLLRPRMSEVW